MRGNGYYNSQQTFHGQRRAIAAGFLLLAVLALAGCSLFNSGPGPGQPSSDDLARTAAAKTVAAWGTALALGGSPTPGLPTVTLTPVPSASATSTRTPVLASSTPASSAPCNQASYIRDVNIPDGSMLTPNSVFIKTWEIKNTGSCAWNNTYAVVFASRGTAMSGAAVTPILQSGEVKPGETIPISVVMRAPAEPGEYEGYWQLRSGDNQNFGVGVNGGGPFYVKIAVGERFSFVEQMCSAKWTTPAGELPCPSKEDNNHGFMMRLDNPTLEDGAQHEGMGLLTVPPPAADGYIAARYPAVMVPEDADFRAVLGCQPGATGCYVRFKVTYRINGEDEQLLGEWSEGYEGGVTTAIKDLDALAGRSVSFTLYLYVSGTPEQARAIWFDPRVTK